MGTSGVTSRSSRGSELTKQMRFAAPRVCKRRVGPALRGRPGIIRARHSFASTTKYQFGAAAEGRPYNVMEITNDHQLSNTEL